MGKFGQVASSEGHTEAFKHSDFELSAVKSKPDNDALNICSEATLPFFFLSRISTCSDADHLHTAHLHLQKLKDTSLSEAVQEANNSTITALETAL